MGGLTEELSILLSKYKAALICRSVNDNDNSVEIGIQDCKAGNLWLGRHHLTGYDLSGNLPINLKPFDISEHELNDHLTELENGSLGVNDSGWIIDKKRSIAIAKALGVTGEDLL